MGEAGVGGAGRRGSPDADWLDEDRHLVLLVGAVVSWLPLVGLIGAALTVVGAVLVILGRKPFGPAHRRNVLTSLIVFAIGVVIAFLGALVAVGIASAAIPLAANEFEIASILEDAFTTIVFSAAVGAFVSGPASVYFTYALQKQEGRLLLWAAYATTVIVQLTTLLVALPALSQVARLIANSIGTGSALDAAAISDAVNTTIFRVQLLKVVPSALYAGANYLVWIRIRSGEIPGPPSPPTAAPIP